MVVWYLRIVRRTLDSEHTLRVSRDATTADIIIFESWTTQTQTYVMPTAECRQKQLRESTVVFLDNACFTRSSCCLCMIITKPCRHHPNSPLGGDSSRMSKSLPWRKRHVQLRHLGKASQRAMKAPARLETASKLWGSKTRRRLAEYIGKCSLRLPGAKNISVPQFWTPRHCTKSRMLLESYSRNS